MSKISTTTLEHDFVRARSSAAMTILLLSLSVTVVVASSFRSADAVTFRATQIIEGTPSDAEAPDIAASEENVYIIWHEFPPDADPANSQPDVYFARSEDRGRNFDDHKNLSKTPIPASGDEQIAATGNNVYVVWQEFEFNVQSDIVFRRSTNRGASFAAIKKLNATLKDSGGPQIAARGKHVVVVWTAEGPSGLPDVFIARSDDGGGKFEDPQNVSDNDQESADPEVAISDEKVIVTWRDFTTPPSAGAEIMVRQGGL